MSRLAFALFLFAAACTTASAQPAVNTDMVLIVSNQSFAVSPVDIVVRIDGREVIRGNFAVGGQHTFTPYTLHLAAGVHTLEARTKAGRAVLARSFELRPDKRFATLMYWYYPKSHYAATPEHFSFDQYAQQPMFD